MIDGPPQIMTPTFDFHKDLIQMPFPGRILLGKAFAFLMDL